VVPRFGGSSFLDCDNTLMPMVARPEEVGLSPEANAGSREFGLSRAEGLEAPRANRRQRVARPTRCRRRNGPCVV